MTENINDIAGLCRQGPMCPAPARVCASHWMSHMPFAFWLMGILRPKLLVELGAYNGASFCAFCQAIERLGAPCEAYAVDLWQGDVHMGHYGEEVYADLAAYVKACYQGFACLVRSSFDDALAQFQAGTIDLLHLDGCHTRAAITHDFEAWLPKMSSRGVVLIHDTRARLRGYGGVAAWEEIAARFPSFIFPHGYGLGVVLAGSAAPQPLKELAGLDSSAFAGIADLFQRQGRIYERLFALDDQRRSEAAAAKAAQADAREHVQALEKILAAEREAHAKQCAAYEAQRDGLKNSLMRANDSLLRAQMDARLREQALTGSISWKITAPLRKLASLWRS